MQTSARVEGVGQMWTPADRGYEKGSFFVDALYGQPLSGNPQHLEKYLKRQCLTKTEQLQLTSTSAECDLISSRRLCRVTFSRFNFFSIQENYCQNQTQMNRHQQTAFL